MYFLYYSNSSKEDNKMEQTDCISTKYQKESLPEDLIWEIIKDESDANLDKNQLTIEVNQKLTEGQIATLAEIIYNSKPKRNRFYIWYHIKNINQSVAWAMSHYDPDLEIIFNGSTIKEDEEIEKQNQVEGDIIGTWKSEVSLMGGLLIMYTNEDQYHLKMIFKDGSKMNEKLTKKGKSKFLINNSHGEYYIINKKGDLDMYDNSGKFDTAIKQ